MDYAEVELPVKDENYYPGCSFLPMLDNSRPVIDWRDVQFGEYGDLRMVRTATYKLFHRYLDGSAELFDLVHDPLETINLIHKPDK